MVFSRSGCGYSRCGECGIWRVSRAVHALDSSSPDRQSLSTPVAAYVHDNGMEVALIGAIHVAEPEYYDRLNKLFRRYDVLLFEMIGGEGLRREEELRRKIDRSKPLGG